MRRFYSTMLFFMLVHIAVGQNPLSKEVDFFADDEPLESVLYRLGGEAKINLAFSSDIFPEDLRISFPRSKTTVRNILDTILKSTGIGFTNIGNQIALFQIKAPKNKYTISGFIKDDETGEVLVGANIYVPLLGKGTSSNAYGFFSLSLEEGNHEIQFSYLGYKQLTTQLNFKKDTHQEVNMVPSLTLQPIIVTANETSDFNKPIRSDILNLEQIEILPSVGGEADIFRFAAMQPGVVTGADGIGGLHIRGGSIDQNLILLDDVIIYNPTHMVGVFSVFNSYAVKSAQLLKGNFPARYGGRLSSVLDVRTKDGNFYNWSTSFGAGLSALSFSTEGPIIKGKSSLFISGRWSPLNLLIKPISKQIKSKRNNEGDTEYLFYDLNAKLNYTFSEKDKMYLSFYKGRDRYNDEGRVNYVSDQVFRNEDITFQDLKWGNTLGSLRWNHLISNQLFLNTSLTYSNYQFNSQGSFSHTDTLITDGSILNEISLSQFNSDITDIGIKTDLDYSPSLEHQLKFGAELINHSFTPGINSSQLSVNLDFDIDNIRLIFFDTLKNPTIRIWEASLYVEDNIQIGDRWSVNIGLRHSSLKASSQWYHSVQPRLSLNINIDSRLNFFASANWMQQHLHLLTTSGIGLPTDVWVPATEKIKPQRSWQISGGWEWKNEKHLKWGIEGYYKKMSNLINYQEISTIGFINSSNWENNVAVGKGEAYGMEMVIEKKMKKTMATLSYTLAWANRQFDETVNLGRTFPFSYDRRHVLSFNGMHHFNEKWSLSADWIYGSGLPISLSTGKYDYLLPTTFLFGTVPALVFAEKNSFRLPANHRLDIETNLVVKRLKIQQIFSFGVYNVYNRKNPIYYRRGTNPENPSEFVYLSASLIPIMPYFSYKIQF